MRLILYCPNCFDRINILLPCNDGTLLYEKTNMKLYKKALFRFRQDLRVEDNTALFYAQKNSEQVLPVFILDENILSKLPANDKRLSFLLDSLKFLDQQLRLSWSRLYVFYWRPEEIIPQLILNYQLEAIFCNKSYWSYWSKRDWSVSQYCHEHLSKFHAYPDYLLVDPSLVPARKVFTPFFKLWQKTDSITSLLHYESLKINHIDTIEFSHNNDIAYDKIGQQSVVQFSPNGFKYALENFNFSNYENTRNYPFIENWVSRLSPYIRFWLVSIRQIYKKALQESAQVYISELAWRDFWHHISHHFPYSLDLEFQEKRRNIKRENDLSKLEAWKLWKTGYPIVDAGMRQLLQQWWMHNRIRMVVASFLCKDLLIDRRYWEEHFANHLLDYVESINIWNWQWSASVWADPKPLRIFSPILQSERFDPNAVYIKEFIPELNNVDPAIIHNPLKYDLWYCKPIVDHAVSARLAKDIYRNM